MFVSLLVHVTFVFFLILSVKERSSLFFEREYVCTTDIIYATFAFEAPHADQSRYNSGLSRTLPFNVWKHAGSGRVKLSSLAQTQP